MSWKKANDNYDLQLTDKEVHDLDLLNDAEGELNSGDMKKAYAELELETAEKWLEEHHDKSQMDGIKDNLRKTGLIV